MLTPLEYLLDELALRLGWVEISISRGDFKQSKKMIYEIIERNIFPDIILHFCDHKTNAFKFATIRHLLVVAAEDEDILPWVRGDIKRCIASITK